MSFIVRGIDLPKKGERYHIFIENGRMRCDKWTNINRSYLDERYAGEINVQAIQIPKDHGRLIDADKLESHEEFDGYGFTKSVYADDIENAPTILSEESEEE